MTEEHTLQESVFRAFLENPDLGPSEMAKRLNAKYNDVKAIFAKLCEEGLLNQKGPGRFRPNIPKIILYIMNRNRGSGE